MDRPFWYYGQVLRDTDLLNGSRFPMVGLGKLAEAVLGAGIAVQGFAIAPTAPASLSVNVGPGQVYQLANLEATQWAAFGPDAHSIIKQGVALDSEPQTFVAPTGVGQAQNFLVQVAYADQDLGQTDLPYYNANAPAQPFSGPANSGTSQNTVRAGVANLTVKAGLAAASGSQTTPTPDPGFAGLYVVTLAYGQTTVTAGNIAPYANAPFIPVTLPGVPLGVQSGKWRYGIDSGTASALVVSLNPPPAALTPGMEIIVAAAAAPMGATVANVAGFGNLPVVRRGNAAVAANDWSAGDMLALRLNAAGSAWMLGGIVPSDIALVCGANGALISGADTGTATGIVVSSPLPGVTALRPWMVLVTTPANVNTGALTINLANLGAKPVIYPNGSAFLGGEMQPRPQIFVYDGTSWEWQGQQTPVLQQATTFYVSPGGSDTNNGLTPATPLRSIQAAVNRTALFNLNSFNVTILVADGTYAGPITLPAISGSGAVTIQGNLTTPGNVIVNSNTQGFLSGGTGKYTIAGLRVITIGNGFQLGTGADWALQNLDYGPCSAAHISVDGGTATLAGTQNISGNAVVHAGATNGGTIKVPSAAYPTLTFTTGGTFSSAFILASVGAKMGLIYASITGAAIASGPRFNVASNAVINTNGGGLNYYPGSSAGVQSTGGQYI